MFYETLAALRGVVNWVGMMPDADAPATIAAKPQAFERGHLTTEAGLRSAAYGRGADSSRSTVPLFGYKDRLYQIEAKALPGQNVSGPLADVVRFHQSLTFTDGGSNRSEEAVRVIREVCRRLVNPGFGAGLDDPAPPTPKGLLRRRLKCFAYARFSSLPRLSAATSLITLDG
jgi:hypothetical protein